MTILSRPVPSTSFRAWDTIAGGSNNFLVQQRTQEGLVLNKTVVHRATHKATDLTPFRIIYSTMAADYESNPLAKAASPSRPVDGEASPTAARLVVAVADKHAEILDDWDEIKECWRRASGGAVKMSEWEDFYQGIIRMRKEEEQEDGGEELHHSSVSQQGDDGDASQVGTGRLQEGEGEPAIAPSLRRVIRRDETSEEASNVPSVDSCENLSFARLSGGESSGVRGTPKQDTAANADHLSGCSREEIWAARVVSAWYWTDSYLSTLVMCVFFHGWIGQWMSWWTAVIMIYLAGQTFPRYHRVGFRKPPSSSSPNGAPAALQQPPPRDDCDEEDEIAVLGMSAANIRHIVENIRSWQASMGVATARDLQSKLVSIVLLNYALSVFAPKWTLVVLFETLVCPLVPLSLFAAMLRVFLVPPSKTAFTSPQVPSAVPPVTAPAVPAGSLEKRPTSSLRIELTTAGKGRGESPEPLNPFTTAASPLTAGGSITRKAFHELITKPLQLYHSTEWKVKQVKQGVTFEEMQSPYCDKRACRFTMNIAGTNCRALHRMVCDDPDGTNKDSYSYKFDRLLTGKKILQKYTEEPNALKVVVAQTLYKSPVWGVTARDMVTRFVPAHFVLKRSDQEQLNIVPKSCQSSEFLTKEVFLQTALNHGTKVPDEKGYCRGAVHSYLLLGQDELDGSLTLCMTMSVDPQGSIPASIVELTNAEQVTKMLLMKEFLQKIGPLPAPQEEDEGTAAEPPAQAADANLVDNVSPAPLEVSQSAEGGLVASPSMVGEEIDEMVRKWTRELYFAADWTLQPQSKDGITYSLKPSPWCEKKAVRVEMFVEGVKAHSLDRVINNPELTVKYDRLMRTKKKVKDVTERVSMFHTLYASPIWGIAPRDFVTYVSAKNYLNVDQQAELGLLDLPTFTPGAEKGVVFIHVGRDGGKDLPLEPKFERGAAHCFGFMAQEEVVNGEVKGVRLVSAFSADPCGNIPVSLVDATNAEQMEKVKIIAKMMKGAS